MHIKFPNKYYFINEFNTKNIDKLERNTAIIFRNYNSDINLKSIDMLGISDFKLIIRHWSPSSTTSSENAHMPENTYEAPL